MVERKHIFPVLIVWSDVLIGAVVSWALKKILDFMYDFSKSKFAPLKSSILMRNLGLNLIVFSLPMMTDFDKTDPIMKTSFFSSTIKSVLESHARGHRRDNIENCELCRLINKHKGYFRHAFPSDALYPPFIKKSYQFS